MSSNKSDGAHDSQRSSSAKSRIVNLIVDPIVHSGNKELSQEFGHPIDRWLAWNWHPIVWPGPGIPLS